MKKWEHCLVTMTSKDMRAFSYENPGPRVEPIVRKAGENDDAPALSRAVADLGSQGWEMISPGSLVNPGQQSSLALYFKRPLGE
ncbi:MAG: hypothetical protein QOF33_2197 [Thermomicrobiales bacterium]|jgi:hypothetical protein|nr:hypothetical protein [Thermomicrobiales bacterium]